MRRLSTGFIGFSKWVAALFVVLIMAGCHTGSGQLQGIPTLPHKVDGASDANIIEMQSKFYKKGVKVVTLGQDYLLSIPSDALFADQSPQLTWGSYNLLNEVACYLQQFRKIAVSVTAYSTKCVSPARGRALTLARSKAVADYLWSQGIDSRFIFTHGLGSDKPITGYAQGGEQSPNSRIEITFRDAVA